jgi:DNA-3-methyladenine glycosylase
MTEVPAHRRLHGPLVPVDAGFYAREATTVARDLLGKLLVKEEGMERIVVRLVEAEAYRQDDPASHAFRGRTPRVETMFGPVGRAYVYFTYGMHWCLNVSCEADGVGAAVLLRAGAIIDGLEVVRARRGPRHTHRDLLSGPARLTSGLGLDGRWDGIDLTDHSSPLWIADDGWRPPGEDIQCGPRVGIRVAADVSWRWWIGRAVEVSRYSRHPGVQREE